MVLGAEGRARAATYEQGPEATAGLILGALAVVAGVIIPISGA